MYLLVGGSGLNVVHACNPFFFFFKMSTRHAYQWSDGFEVSDVLPRGPTVWNLGRASQRSKDLNFGCASQRSMD